MSDLLQRMFGSERRGGVFYLHGDDEFRKDEAARALIEAHVDPGVRDFNLDVLRGPELDVEALASLLQTPPMMAEWRVVVVRETEALARSSRTRALLVDTAASPPDGLALILVCTPPSKARFYKDLAREARSAEFSNVSPNDVPRWVQTRAREAHGREITEEAARALGAAVGTDLGVLASEIAKLASFVEEGRAIDRPAVEAAGIRLPTVDRWRWFDLVGKRDFTAALDSLGTLLSQQGESGVGLVIGLATHLLRLGVVGEEGLPALERVLPKNQKWLVRSIGRSLAAQAAGWTTEELQAALTGLLRVDRLLKSSGLSDESLIEEWLLTEAVRVRERRDGSGGRTGRAARAKGGASVGAAAG